MLRKTSEADFLWRVFVIVLVSRWEDNSPSHPALANNSYTEENTQALDQKSANMPPELP